MSKSDEISLREYFEAILIEQQKAIEQANAEREKAASILRQSLIEKVQVGDAALDRHIQEQIQQIRNLIDAQSKLVAQAHDSSQLAIAKAEQATERRLALLNEFRSQLADEADRYASQASLDEAEKSNNRRLTRLDVQVSRLYGGIIAIGALGIANLVKIWIGHS